MLHFKLTEKQEQVKAKIRRWKEIIRIRAKLMKQRPKNLYKESMKKKVDYLKL
jgi:hypothetical protein